ncbi:MAG: translation initiation factor IF-2 [Acidobacteriota bacterium]
MMKLPEQDLMFKLKSIGVRIEGEDAAIDSDIIQAILQGKRLPQPREVILRDNEGVEQPEPQPVARPAAQPRRPAPSPMRGRRSMIQRVEPKIQELEPKGKVPGEPADPSSPVEAAPQVAAETAPAAPVAEAPAPAPVAAAPAAEAKPEPKPEVTAKTAEPAAKQPEPAKVVKKPEPKPARSKLKARLVERATPGQPLPQARGPEGRPVSRPPRPARPGGPPPPGPGRGRGRRPGGHGNDRRFRPPARRVESPPPIQREPASERGRRRAQKRQEAPANPGLQFKDARPEGPVTITHGMTVRDFAEKLGVKSKDLIKTLLGYGMLATVNHTLDPEMAKKLADDLGVEIMEVSFEEEVQLQHESAAEAEGDAEKEPRAPVITVMGHVDHGKTTLLDSIRSTKVADGEAGGITQHIGAYHVDLDDGRTVVFLDTPGHEAFTMMRARGAKVTDIVVLVVAADDGVMPQTVEAIDHARAAGVPLVVAINKIDKANANLDRVRKELADNDLLVEDWGGDVVSVPLSALKGEGIDELLEMILLNAELLELKASPSLPAQGVILEARKEVGLGIVATVVIQDGSLSVGDVFVAGSTWGRIRTMTDDRGSRLKTTGPSTAVEITGFDDLPNAGDLLQVHADEGRVREIAQFRSHELRARELAPQPSRLSLENLFEQIGKEEVKELPVVVKGDVHGSVEVLRDSLVKQSTEKVKVNVIHASVGAISTNDVVLASASNAIVVGFNVRPERKASSLAEKEAVDIRLHTVIYELLDEIKLAMAGLLEPVLREVQKGVAEIRETFKVPKIGVVAGCHVTEGVVPRNAQVRLLRDNIVVYEGKIASLRRFKEDTSEVRAGFDCGIGLEGFQDVKPGDLIEAFIREEVAATL